MILSDNCLSYQYQGFAVCKNNQYYKYAIINQAGK